MSRMRVAKTCPICSQVASVEVPLAEFEAYQRGALIQDALKSLTSAEREVVKSGIHSDCWDKTFGGEDDLD